ncbi:MAG: hypothetical protein BA862_08755 [Desulfobulbaceae bacterium S3730MH12]|nr:MAG: hypothetical protein BA866_07575 [Desulfobulbaceae bacterium S5133MH15]OEU55958.1 MAG: hypothetical protein BA862_08755 [Desulfobulbaceae bacterium S3730MH12]OEU82907.1 MAG: hypothetical protein BA873_16750 [Desulfobulbaceae bacterium C00003063]
MPNEYSVEIHNYLSKKLAEITEKQQEHPEKSAYLQGRLKELQWLREYLGKHIDLKDFKYH